VLIFLENQCFVAATHFGNLFVYKWSEIKKLVYTLKNHIKAIISLVYHPILPNLFISASIDSSIRIWDIEVT
jgi:WD40 repeat protein